MVPSYNEEANLSTTTYTTIYRGDVRAGGGRTFQTLRKTLRTEQSQEYLVEGQTRAKGWAPMVDNNASVDRSGRRDLLYQAGPRDSMFEPSRHYTALDT